MELRERASAVFNNESATTDERWLAASLCEICTQKLHRSPFCKSCKLPVEKHIKVLNKA